MLLVWLVGCSVLRALQGADVYEDPCEERSPFWADTDADGVGDTGSVYVGCGAPDGYTDVPPLSWNDTDPGDSGDTDP